MEGHGQSKCRNFSLLQNQKLMTQIHLSALNVLWLKVNHINSCEHLPVLEKSCQPLQYLEPHMMTFKIS